MDVQTQTTCVVKVNRRNPNWTLYIGREWAGLPASKWANPFRIPKPFGVWAASSEEGRRNFCLQQYEAYVRSRPDLMAALHEIDGQVLGCWCHPLSCHGDVLIKLRKEQIEHDVQRLKEFTQEALHPTSPTPGHAEGCVCHRCRIYREETQACFGG